MTRGVKSSEFIITVLTLIIAPLMAYLNLGDYITETIAVAGVYVGGRSAVKSFKGEENV